MYAPLLSLASAVSAPCSVTIRYSSHSCWRAATMASSVVPAGCERSASCGRSSTPPLLNMPAEPSREVVRHTVVVLTSHEVGLQRFNGEVRSIGRVRENEVHGLPDGVAHRISSGFRLGFSLGFLVAHEATRLPPPKRSFRRQSAPGVYRCRESLAVALALAPASLRRLTDTGGVTSPIDPTAPLRSGCLARDDGCPSEEMRPPGELPRKRVRAIGVGVL